jgi:hypothetical protein
LFTQRLVGVGVREPTRHLIWGSEEQRASTARQPFKKQLHFALLFVASDKLRFALRRPASRFSCSAIVTSSYTLRMLCLYGSANHARAVCLSTRSVSSAKCTLTSAWLSLSTPRDQPRCRQIVHCAVVWVGFLVVRLAVGSHLKRPEVCSSASSRPPGARSRHQDGRLA